MSADLCLLAGSPLDAYQRYCKAAELCKACLDPIWHAAQIAASITPSAGFGWTSLLSSDIDTSRAIVHTSNFSLTPGLMTVDFNFITWIK
mgnify:CR=1 FL=1